MTAVTVRPMRSVIASAMIIPLHPRMTCLMMIIMKETDNVRAVS